MRTLIPLIALAALTPGCIYYDDDCSNSDDCWGWSDCDDDDDVCDVDPDPDPDPDPEPQYTLSISPDSAEAGTDVMVRLTAEGDFDLWSVVDVDIAGGCEVLSVIVKESHVLVVVDVPDSARLGPANVVVQLDGGDRVVLDGAFEVLEPGTATDPCED